MKKILIYFFLVSCLLSLVSHVYADYVLPYPSYMPGNKIYRISRIVDLLKKYWYFGNLGKIKYHMQLSDKYLVEAKTLMEYNQYLLAVDALKQSDNEFDQLPEYLQGASSEHVDITVFMKLITEEATKHKEILLRLVTAVPEEFLWTPEKAKSTRLNLRDLLQHSISDRERIINNISDF